MTRPPSPKDPRNRETAAARVTLQLDDDALELLADLVARRLDGTGSVTSTTAPGTATVYSVRTLASALDVSERTIRGAIHRGELRAEKRGRRYLIPSESVTAWATPTPTRQGRPTRTRTRPSAGTLTATLAMLGERA